MKTSLLILSKSLAKMNLTYKQTKNTSGNNHIIGEITYFI